MMVQILLIRSLPTPKVIVISGQSILIWTSSSVPEGIRLTNTVALTCVADYPYGNRKTNWMEANRQRSRDRV